MTRRIAILPTGDWAEVSKTLGDVEYVTLNERQFDEVCNSATQNTMLELHEGLTAEGIDAVLGIEATTEPISKEQFLAWFRSDEYSEQLSVDEKIGVFMLALAGSSDITKERLVALGAEYETDVEALFCGNTPAATGISDRAWRFALNECLSCYDESKTPQEVLSDVVEMTGDIVVWEPFKDYDGAWLAATITALAKQTQNLIGETHDQHITKRKQEIGV